MAVAHPGDDATFGFTVLAFGGPAVFLLAERLFSSTRRASGPCGRERSDLSRSPSSRFPPRSRR